MRSGLLRGAGIAAAALLASGAALAATGSPAVVDRPSRREFFKDSRGQLALARAEAARTSRS